MRRRLTDLRSVRCIYRLGLDSLAQGKDWTRDPLVSGGAWFTLGIHAFDLVRWLAAADGVALTQLRAEAKPASEGGDFPLCVELRGRLPNGTELIAGADLQGNRSFQLDLQVEPSEARLMRESLPGPWPQGEASGEVEYAAMMADFVEAAEAGQSDRNDVPEILQTHRDLLRAQELAGG